MTCETLFAAFEAPLIKVSRKILNSKQWDYIENQLSQRARQFLNKIVIIFIKMYFGNFRR